MTTKALETIDAVNKAYFALHEDFENHFWSTKMALTGNDRALLTQARSDLDDFLADAANLAKVEAALASLEGVDTPEAADQAKVLAIMKKTFVTYSLSDPAARALKSQIVDLEQVLAGERNGMKLGYTDPTSGEFIEASSVQLRTLMRVSEEEPLRKACYEGLSAITDLVASKLGEIIKLRNRLARLEGYQDFYDMNVTMAEGFSRQALFEMLDKLEQPSREINAKARAALKEEKAAAGFDPLAPWNTGFALSGSIAHELSPFFPFATAVESWGKSFARLGINYRGSNLNLDLLGKK